MKKTITALVAATALTLTGCAGKQSLTDELAKEYEVGSTIPLDDGRMLDAFTTCRKSSALELENYKEPDVHDPKFAYMAGDGFVVLGLTFETVPKREGSFALKRVLATCAMQHDGELWRAKSKADMIPVVGGALD